MLVLDVSVVLAAHRADHPHHGVVRPWFEALVGGDDDFGVPDLVWASFLRVATNRRIFKVPSPVGEAFAFIDATTSQRHHLRVAPGPRHFALVRRLCEEFDASGDLVPGAVLGAVAVEHGATVITLDRDFSRFASVRHRRPGEDGSALA